MSKEGGKIKKLGISKAQKVVEILEAYGANDGDQFQKIDWGTASSQIIW